MSDNLHPETWSTVRRSSFLAHGLAQFLATAPTATDAWVLPVDELEEKTAQADQISALMDAVSAAPLPTDAEDQADG
ncbi:hypothetical protein [Actinocorallia longicatena]|uniref:Uncharacterized protein n=1 Tax=Actinocorallia longicatena TaxID=111803 RepID=A0ABP6QEQ0_9ACTN